MITSEIRKDVALEQMGYAESDLLAWNPETMKFAMKNGGLYQIDEQGQIEHIDGPSPDPTERI